MARYSLSLTIISHDKHHHSINPDLTRHPGQPGSEDAQKLQTSLLHAISSGYRLIDTAQAYGVESVVGAAIRASPIPRSSLTVVTKFVATATETPAQALAKSLKDLDVDYIDVFLLHWPNVSSSADAFGGKFLGRDEKPSFVDVWKAMEKLLGPTCRAIGVSNFSQLTLATLLDDPQTRVVPAVNQVELHALNPNLALVPWCKERGVHVMSWSTLGGNSSGGTNSSDPNPILTDALFVDLARKYNVSPGVISLSWAVQRGVTVIPMSSKLERIEENIKLVTLSEGDFERVNKASETIGRKRLADGLEFAKGHVPGKGDTLLGWTLQEFGWEDERGNWLV